MLEIVTGEDSGSLSLSRLMIVEMISLTALSYQLKTGRKCSAMLLSLVYILSEYRDECNSNKNRF